MANSRVMSILTIPGVLISRGGAAFHPGGGKFLEKKFFRWIEVDEKV
jgi:hypothetical protein